jgi:hypothetical protein
MEFAILIPIAAIWITAAAYGAYVAGQKGYDSGMWLLGGFVFGPLVLVAAAGLPDRKRPDSDACCHGDRQ